MSWKSSKSEKPQSGLIVLPPPEADWITTHGNPTLDVVVVHGLNGDCMRTWTTEQSSIMWPRDLLPYKLPNARVMTFGYNASIFGNTSIAGVRDNARKLLGMMRDMREENDVNRPLVFVCHSLGGIIVKQALRIANNEMNQYSDIAESTKGIVFFGTPHRGANPANWLSLVAGIAATAFGKPKSAFIETLKPNSKDLMEISEDFRSIAQKYALISFFEEDAYSGIGVVIVEKHSAVMELPHEEVMVLGGTHQSMCRYEKDDPRFEPVWRRIRRAANGPSKII